MAWPLTGFPPANKHYIVLYLIIIPVQIGSTQNLDLCSYICIITHTFLYIYWPTCGVLGKKDAILKPTCFHVLRVRGQDHLQKSAAGAGGDCSRPLLWSKCLLREETKETWSPLTPLLMPGEKVKYCLVFGFSKKKKRSKWRFNFLLYACAFGIMHY